MNFVPQPHAYTSIEDDVRRRRILRHATRAFLSHGYAGTSVENIAIDASVSKVTIYRVFGDKLGLARAVLLELSASLEADCRAAIDMTASPEDCLTNFGVTYIRWMNKGVGKTRNYEYLRLLMEICSAHAEIARAWTESYSAVIVRPLSRYLESRIASGVLDGEDPYFMAAQFLGTLYHTSQSIVTYNEINDNIDLTRRKVRLFLRGCVADEAAVPKAAVEA